MAENSTRTDPALIAVLNDLLQLDHDAVQAYGIAVARIRNAEHKATLQEFRGDHERHIEELTRYIRGHDGAPVELPHLPSGVFKLAVQAIGALAGDRALLLAFKANERQVRDKYRDVAGAAQEDPELGVLLSRAAGDEQRHYAWVLETLEELGVGADTRAGRIENAFEIGHARMADVMESAERRAMEASESVRRDLSDEVRKHPLRTLLFAVGAGIVVSRLIDRR